MERKFNSYALALSLILSLISPSVLKSQDFTDCTEIDPRWLISTNPVNPFPSSPPVGREWEKNTWDWTLGSWPVNSANYPSSSLVNSPYYSSLSVYAPFSLPPFSPFLDKDFHWEDGWELLKRDFGFIYDNTTPKTIDIRAAPYFILYNKFTGRLRVFAAFADEEQANSLGVILRFDQDSPFSVESTGSSTGVSSSLNVINGINQPLDKEIRIFAQVGSTVYVNEKIHFSVSDFQIGYDPCICNRTVGFEVAFVKIKSFDIKLINRMIGDITPIELVDNSYRSNYKNFLSSLSVDGLNFNNLTGGAGLRFPKNIDYMVNEFKRIKFEQSQLAVVNFFFNTAIPELFKAGIKAGLPLITTLIDSNVYEGDRFLAHRGKELLGAGANSLVSKIKNPFSVPNASFPSFFMAEGISQGFAQTEIELSDYEIRGYWPGSRRPINTPEQYSFIYDKPLGVFNLLRTPTISQNHSSVLVPRDVPQTCDNWALGYHYEMKSMFRVSNMPDLIINPVLGVDFNKSDFKFAFIVKVPSNIARSNCHVYPPHEAYNLKHIATISNEGQEFDTLVYTTPNLNFGCIDDFRFGFKDYFYTYYP